MSFDENKIDSIIQSVSFSVEKGSISIIRGKSGAGKSTFLSILGGIERPDKGTVHYKDMLIYDLPDEKLAKVRGEDFGFIFQSYNLVPELSVIENIELPFEFISKKGNRDETLELAKDLGITEQLYKYPASLSGGEQQRVAIARAMITSPKVIFADEPTGNLDTVTSKYIMDLLIRLCDKEQTALIIVTHEQELLTRPHNSYNIANGKLYLDDTYA